MYNNSGKKIKGLATFFCTLGMIGSCLSGIGMMIYGISEDEILLGLLLGVAVAGVGCLVAWLSGLLMAGFGELIQNSYEILQIMKKSPKGAAPAKDAFDYTPKHDVAPQPETPKVPVPGVCPKCGCQNKPGSVFCFNCGSKL